MGLRYAKPVLRREFREYTECTYARLRLLGVTSTLNCRAGSLREVKAAWRNQRRIAPELLLNRQTYRDVLQCNDRTSDRQFTAFDFTEKGVVSALIVFGTVLLLSKGDATDKLQCTWAGALFVTPVLIPWMCSYFLHVRLCQQGQDHHEPR